MRKFPGMLHLSFEKVSKRKFPVTTFGLFGSLGVPVCAFGIGGEKIPALSGLSSQPPAFCLK